MAFKTPREAEAEKKIAERGWKRDKKTGLWKCFRAPDRGRLWSGTAVELAATFETPDTPR
ncbi:hypothetical protein [Aureimonas glaciei]|jgi:hypothetical protein|uniref:Uncharacterized protein n=1 Tax=Aureimonas glaciei TaxID=1776957 RepID=A0A916XYK5_9HYPH|nr:hypothetical protein [Aureimonas glaciei]GGD22380.1 hypothetical protein GCM10011335_26590 [Aureimonas glaciei]